MKIKPLLLILVVLFVITACSDASGKTANLPAPGELYAGIEEAAGLREMIELTPEELTNLTGIESEAYTAFAAYQAGWGMSPDEIIIVQAADAELAESVEEKLTARLEYKRKSAQDYITENLPVLNKAVVRRDGLTVSLIVADDIESAQGVYEK